VAGLAPGRWTISDAAGQRRAEARVAAGRNTALWLVGPGSHIIERQPGNDSR